MRSIREPARRISVVSQADVVVSGGGLTGVMAAVGAARAGAFTLLTERLGFFGGAAAMWLTISGMFDCHNRKIVHGLAQELIDRLRAIGGAAESFTYCGLLYSFQIIDPEAVKQVCLEFITESGVELQLHTWTVDVQTEIQRVCAIVIENKTGRQTIGGMIFVDATEDGDVAAWAGAPYWVGRETDGYPQSATITMRMDGIDTERLRQSELEQPERYDLYGMPRQQFRTNRRFSLVGPGRLVKQAAAEGYPPLPVERVSICSLLEPGAMLINMTKVKQIMAHHAQDLTRGEMEERKQVPLVAGFLRSYVPGFENARLTATGPSLGVRETRHIEGDTILTLQDVRLSRSPADTIAVGGDPIDIHSPSGGAVELERTAAYGIPYSCLTPKHTDNVLVAGRALSAAHEALASARVMGTCIAMDQAAGEAAAWTVREECSTRQVDLVDLQSRLRANRAILLDDSNVGAQV